MHASVSEKAILTVGCVILASVYFLKTYRSEESCNIIHIGVNSVYQREGYESPKSHDRYFFKDLIMLKGFNEDIIDKIYMDKNIRDLKLRIKDGNVTYHEYVECYTTAFNNAKDKLKEKSECPEMELDRGDLREILQMYNYQNKHFSSEFVTKFFFGSTQQNIKNDKDFRASFKKLLLLGYFDLLLRNRSFVLKIFAFKTLDALINYSGFKLKNCYKSIHYELITYQNCYFNDKSRDDDHIKVRTKNIDNRASFFNIFYIDLTSTILDMVCDVNTEYPKTSSHGFSEYEQYMTESVFRTLAIATKWKNCNAGKTGFKFIIVFDQLSVIEYARIHFFEHEDMLESILVHLDKLVRTVQIKVSKRISAGELDGIKLADVEFLEQKELIKLKVGCHASTKQFIEKYAMPDFGDIAKKLELTFETPNGNKTFRVARCRIIDSLVKNIFDKSYDRSRNNPRFKEAVEAIDGGCNSCKRQDTHCEICADFLREFEYVYAKIISYCLTLEDNLKLSGLE